MKKDQGGYVLVYVVVVIAVLTALSAAVCSVAVQNLRAQQAAVEQLQQRTLAEGEVEKAIAQIEGYGPIELTILVHNDTQQTEQQPPTDAEIEKKLSDDYVYDAISYAAKSVDESCLEVAHEHLSEYLERYTIRFNDGNVLIEAELEVVLNKTLKQYIPVPENQTNDGNHTYIYTITIDSITCTAYRVERTG